MALKFITPTKRLRTDAAASWKRMVAQGAPSSRLESAWRSKVTQQKLYDGWVRGLPGYNFALPPSQSNHVKGIAVDTYGPLQDWLVKNGPRNGWTRDKNEAWHFDYDAANDAELTLNAAHPANTNVLKVKKVQAILKVTRDGIPGPQTRAAWVDTMRRSKAGQFWYKRRFSAIRKVLGTKDTATTEKAWANVVHAVK